MRIQLKINNGTGLKARRGKKLKKGKDFGSFCKKHRGKNYYGRQGKLEVFIP